MNDAPMDAAARAETTTVAALRRRWRTCMALTTWLMLAGALVTFGVAWWARDLKATLFGWPFSFWVAAQGAPVLYLVLVCVYARAMRRLDRRHEAEDDLDDDGAA